MYSYIIYVDEVLLGNLIVNLMILWATARLARIKTTNLRLFMGAILGGFYSIAFYIPALIFLFSVPSKVLVSLIIMLTTFGFMPIKRFLVTLGYFYFTSFAIGGITLGVSNFLGTQTDLAIGADGFLASIQDFFWYGIFLAFVFLYILAKWGPSFWKRHLAQETYFYPLHISFGNETVKVNSFLDTGNHLSDPLTGYPVVVVEYDVLKNILPQEIRGAILAGSDNERCAEDMLERLSDSKWIARFRVIPFRGVGSSNGLLYGFRPDKIVFTLQGDAITVSHVLIGVSRGRLDSEGAYRALLHPKLLTGVGSKNT